MENTNQKENCCDNKNPKGILHGLLFGFIPHIGCVAFIVFSLVGASFASSLFYPFMTNKWLSLPVLFAFSLGLATISASIYLARKNSISVTGLKENKKYLATLFATVISVNLAMIYWVFPAVTHMSTQTASMYMMAGGSDSCADDSCEIGDVFENFSIKTELPCSGHAPFITETLRKEPGVKNISYKEPDVFFITYNPEIISAEKLLSSDILKEFKARKI